VGAGGYFGRLAPFIIYGMFHIDFSHGLSFSLNKAARTLLDKTWLVYAVIVGLGFIIRIPPIKKSILAYRIHQRKLKEI
tara:strand:- start:24507 stop:24743 length:237 start_codon:yes stop_codon:yes gene_type:complete